MIKRFFINLLCAFLFWLINFIEWAFPKYCPKCGTKMLHWSAARYDCLNPTCRHKLYTGL